RKRKIEVPGLPDWLEIFPAEEAQFDLKFGEQILNASITLSGNTVRAQAQVSSLPTGNYQLNCTVSLGPITKSAVETVHVYSFPQPSLEIHPSEALVNNLVTVLCNSSAPEPPSFSLQIQNASGRILASSDEFPLQLNLTAQEEDNGQEFVCEVEFKIDGITITKHTSATLTVFYVPEMDELSCPSNHTWVERTQQTLHCLAKGNPKPSVACFKEGIAYDVEEKKKQVDRSQAGIYNCTATNELGSSTRTVTIHVECKITMVLDIILTSSLVVICHLLNRRSFPLVMQTTIEESFHIIIIFIMIIL
uniref:Ig-like domain-containing protein n=1 Tax=Pseudonaja textilis TaxID=8673 RepID=A0A670Y3V3_PSETE